MPATATATRPPLTKIQRNLLTFWLDHFAQHQRFPSFREAMAKTGIKSPNGIGCHLRALERKGYLKRDHAKDKHRTRAYAVPGLREAIASAVNGVKLALLAGPQLAPAMVGLAEIDETT